MFSESDNIKLYLICERNSLFHVPEYLHKDNNTYNNVPDLLYRVLPNDIAYIRFFKTRVPRPVLGSYVILNMVQPSHEFALNK